MVVMMMNDHGYDDEDGDDYADDHNCFLNN